jgi:hypothetical protein
MTIERLQARRREAPPGWDVAAFDRVTDALAAALVGAYRRGEMCAPEPEAEELPA